MGRSPFIPIALTKGPFTIAEAREVGLERWHLQGASWRRLGRGTYAWAGLPDTTAARLDSAGKRLPPAAAFSGFTAAWLHGMDAPSNGPLEVTVPKEFGIAARSGMRVRQAFLDGCDVVLVRGKRVTAIERTIAEVCARLSLVEAVVFTDAALHSRRIAVAQLRAWVDARRGWPGVGKLRRVLSYAEPAAESPMESRLRMVLVLGGLPKPTAQVSIKDPNGRFVGRVDLYYEQARLGIEYDGAIHRDTLVEDNRRQNNLLRAGVRLLPSPAETFCIGRTLLCFRCERSCVSRIVPRS